jgi:hypothetical protein
MTTKLTFNAKGELIIKASETSSQNDFDWFVGNWKIYNKKLKARLVNSNEWIEFEATDEVHRILDGKGFANYYRTTFDGEPFEGLSLTLFNPETKLWSIYWADSKTGKMESPSVGSFDGNIGTFYSKDTFNGKDIIVKHQWDITNPDRAVWTQAFSTDKGITWETNWYMYEERLLKDIGKERRTLLKTDSSLKIPELNFDEKGELALTASSTSSQNDFNFLVGKWKMYNRKLKKRLENCNDWTEFESSEENFKILNGIGDIDTYHTTEMPGQKGKTFEGVTLRLFNPETKLWSLYWIPSDTGIIDPPVTGSFENNVGHFFCKDTFNGKDIIVMFRWDARDKDRPVWSQAFSPDNGKTWEWNWYMELYNVSERIKE